MKCLPHALLLLAATACGPEGAIKSEEGTAMVAIHIPETRTYAGQPRARIELPREYFWERDSDEAKRGLIFKPISYVTKRPTDDLSSESGDVIQFFATVRYFAEDSGIPQFYERFEDTGEMRFGLSYRPEPVPGRPEALWKRVYLKSDVSGDVFNISCVPPVAPGTIVAPAECTMSLMLAPKQFGDRRAGLELKVSVPVSRLEDWREIESTVVELFESRVEWIEGTEQ